MIKCKYHAIINNVQTAICDYNLIVNELNERIVWYVDEAKEYNFQSPYELNYIVDATDPTCIPVNKSSFKAIVRALTLSSDINVNLIDRSKFKAVFKKLPIYRSEITCSSP